MMRLLRFDYAQDRRNLAIMTLINPLCFGLGYDVPEVIDVSEVEQGRPIPRLFEIVPFTKEGIKRHKELIDPPHPNLLPRGGEGIK